MVVLIYNTNSCCHANEFKGVFESEEIAIDAFLRQENKNKDSCWETVLEKKPSNDYDEGTTYAIISVSKKDGNNRHESNADITVLPLQINSLYY